MTSNLSYSDRAKKSQNPIGKRLLTLMDKKQTNLALSADVTSAQTLLELADLLGSEICVLKTHIDILSDFDPSVTQSLATLAKQHDFLIFEDRKFADIGNTVKQQYAGGVYRIADWSDFINAHCLPGPGIVQGLAEVGMPKERGLILLAEMSSIGHFMDKKYIEQSLKMAEQFPEFVFGFITQHALSNAPQWINMTPGVKLNAGKDNLGQKYITPDMAIKQNGADIIIVGRGIIAAKDPLAEAKQYRAAGWCAYRERCLQ